MSVIGSTLLENIQKIIKVNSYRKMASQTLDPKALSTVARSTSVEPFCVISKDCANLDYMYDINNTLLNMFIAYYLQAVNTFVKLDDVRVRKILNSVGTNVSMMLESQSLNHDMLKFKLPTSTNLSLESNNSNSGKPTPMVNWNVNKGDDLPDLQSYSNLAIGKIIELVINYDDKILRHNKTKDVTMGESTHSRSRRNSVQERTDFDPDGEMTGASDTRYVGDPDITQTSKQGGSKTNEEQLFLQEGKAVAIPIMVRLLVNVVPTRTLESLLVRYKEDISFSERWFSWRAGRIRFWKDLVMCQDLVREHKRTVIDAENDVVGKIDSRVNKAIMTKTANIGLKAATDRFDDIKNIDTMSFGVASNLYVITAAEATKFEYFLGGKLSDIRARNKLFGNGYAMILVVVDPDRERVKFYINGVDGYTDLSVKEIKSMSKNKGPDIGDMLKMLQMGMSPTF